MRKLLSAGLLSVLLFSFMSLPAYAKDGVDESVDSEDVESVEDESTDDSTDDSVDDKSKDDDSSDDDSSDDDSESDVSGEDSDEDKDDDKDELANESFEDEGTVVEGEEGDDETVVSEEVDEDDLSDDMEEALDDASESGDYPDKLYLSVQWGYFPVAGETVTLTDETTWDGSVNFGTSGQTMVAKPYKMIRFEKNSDAIDFDATSEVQTVFESTIAGHNDGILFKIKTDLDDREGSKVWFETDYAEGDYSAYLQDLYNDGSATFTVGDYKVVMKVWTHEDWLDVAAEHADNSGHHNSDVESGSWYEKFKDFSVEQGFFEGYKDKDGQLNGKMGPGDSLTRFQLLKVMYELSGKLDMGASTSGCDPDTVTTDSTTDWMGDNWARGYVQCIENSGLSISLLDTIASSQDKGNMPAYRIEVIATAFEMLDLDTSGAEDSDLSDVHDGKIVSAFADMIDEAVDLRVVEGYPDGSFKPMKTVNRAEMFKIVSLFYEVLSI